MELTNRGEKVWVVAREEAVESFVRVNAQELSDDLYGKRLRIRELGAWAASTQRRALLEPIVYEAEDGDDEGANIHGWGPPLRALIGGLDTTKRSGGLIASSTPRRNLHTGLTS